MIDQQDIDRANEQWALDEINRILETQQERELQAMLEDEEQRKHYTPYRPDETETFRDINEERDWQASERDYHRFMGYE